MNKETWKETRKWYKRRTIIKMWMFHKLKLFKWYLFHLWFKITKYKHKHIWSINFYCLICRKAKRDIDLDFWFGK